MKLERVFSNSGSITISWSALMTWSNLRSSADLGTSKWQNYYCRLPRSQLRSFRPPWATCNNIQMLKLFKQRKNLWGLLGFQVNRMAKVKSGCLIPLIACLMGILKALKLEYLVSCMQLSVYRYVNSCSFLTLLSRSFWTFLTLLLASSISIYLSSIFPCSAT